MKERIVSVNNRNSSEDYYGEVGDLIIDRLLLRYLPSRVNHTRRDQTVLAHLIMNNRLSKPFDESSNLSGIPPLIYEPSCHSFLHQFLRSLLDLFQRSMKTVNEGLCGE